MKYIEAKYKEFYELPFPNGLTGAEIGEIDLVLLDSDSAGLIDKYIVHGKLIQNDVDSLKVCFNELGTVKESLSGMDSEYFSLLYEIVSLVIERINTKSKL